MKECKYLSVDDCCMEDNPCGLTPCQHIKNCYYKQLLAEQAKNKKLVEALEKIAYRDITIKSNFYSSTVANEALNEVNNAK